jgi:hypothetical protein
MRACDKARRAGDSGHGVLGIGTATVSSTSLGYTIGMKTAVSVPDEVYQQIERLARRERRSRSEVYSTALKEYMARHAPDEVTEALDRVVRELGADVDPFTAAAGHAILEATEW